jgi:aldose 1-epimerase
MPDGAEVKLFALDNGAGVVAQVTEFGASLVSVVYADQQGKVENVVQGYDNLQGYVRDRAQNGRTVGRFANRIAGGRFELDGTVYELARNNGPNHLHGGPGGFSSKLWKGEEVRTDDRIGAKFTYTSPDGEEGYPGELTASVTYSLDKIGALRLDYEATTTKPTVCNFTNHSYFNLSGFDGGDVMAHRLQLSADEYLIFDNTLIPTGEIAPVADTPFDFTEQKAIGAVIGGTPRRQYDHCFVIRREGPGLVPVAKVVDPASGRAMEVSSTEPGVQIYTASGNTICLETQHYPDSPNKPDFPTTTLRPGETFRSTSVFRFFVE